eukprot:980828-Pelagomonas_calceolata.AAC.1
MWPIGRYSYVTLSPPFTVPHQDGGMASNTASMASSMEQLVRTSNQLLEALGHQQAVVAQAVSSMQVSNMQTSNAVQFSGMQVGIGPPAGCGSPSREQHAITGVEAVVLCPDNQLLCLLCKLCVCVRVCVFGCLERLAPR